MTNNGKEIDREITVELSGIDISDEAVQAFRQTLTGPFAIAEGIRHIRVGSEETYERAIQWIEKFGIPGTYRLGPGFSLTLWEKDKKAVETPYKKTIWRQEEAKEN